MSFAAIAERLQTLENPYPGLRPFDITESHLFFGRDPQVSELVHRLERNRFVAVVGSSGCGKSSLVRAGLMPALERGGVWAAGRRWRRVVTQPAGAPFERLAVDLAAAGLDASRLRESSHGLIEVSRQLADEESLLLVVDQFEELFRYKDLQPITEDAKRAREGQAAEAAEFVQLLLQASHHHPPIYIVLTMRSDYLGDCAEFRDLPEALNASQYLVPRMTRRQRQQAIEGPLGPVDIAPNLVQKMLNDAGDEPDQLPVLQHALMRTWGQWRKSDPGRTRRIELKDYQDVGGFDGALNQHADELLAAVPNRLAECIFKRLTARGADNRERRDPATLSTLWAVCNATTREQQAEVVAAIDRFRRGDATFLRPLKGTIAPDTYVDITHESLIRLWRKLRDEWLPQEQLSAKTLFEVAERARNWKASSGEPLGGRDLDRVEDWNTQRNKTTAWAAQYVDEATVNLVVEFLDASRAARRRRQLRRSALWGVAAAAVIVVVGGTVWRSFGMRVNEVEAEGTLALARQAQNITQEISAVQQQDIQRLQTELVAQQAIATEPMRPEPAGVVAGSADLKPRVYIQVRPQADAGEVDALAGRLRKAGMLVPPVQVLNTGPSANELRYFREKERATAEEILETVRQAAAGTRLTYVPGFEDAKRIRGNHFELWLAPANLLDTVVQQLNDPSQEVRQAAGGRLARDQRSNPDAIHRVLQTLSQKNLPTLSASGRINALYFLNRSDPAAWTDEHKQLARDAIERLRYADAHGSIPLGAQTTQELKVLEQILYAGAQAKN